MAYTGVLGGYGGKFMLVTPEKDRFKRHHGQAAAPGAAGAAKTGPKSSIWSTVRKRSKTAVCHQRIALTH